MIFMILKFPKVRYIQ